MVALRSEPPARGKRAAAVGALRSILTLAPLVAAVCGCGPSGPATYRVSGTVTYQGKPLPLGIVMFVPKEGPPSKPAVIDGSGRYRLEAVAGPAETCSSKLKETYQGGDRVRLVLRERRVLS